MNEEDVDCILSNRRLVSILKAVTFYVPMILSSSFGLFLLPFNFVQPCLIRIATLAVKWTVVI